MDPFIHPSLREPLLATTPFTPLSALSGHYRASPAAIVIKTWPAMAFRRKTTDMITYANNARKET